ncbi:phosphoribosylanthranilate isomerase [Desulfoplanes sp.]
MDHIVQIAGVRSREEAMALAACNVTHIGFPLCLDYHEEDMDAPTVRSVVAKLPEKVTGVLITYLKKAEKIIGLSGYLGVGSVQLHGRVSMYELARIRRECPRMYIIKSLIIGDDSLENLPGTIASYGRFVDAFLTDTYDVSSGASGATGKVHDWNISKKIVDMSPVPVILAGGLTPENVRLGIEFVRPFGVDAHTGVEGSSGTKDPSLVRSFVREATVGFFHMKLHGGRT